MREERRSSHAISLLLAEGLAVGALFSSGVCLVGAHQDPVQRAVIVVTAVMCTLLNGASDALVCMTAHEIFLLFFRISSLCPYPFDLCIFIIVEVYNFAEVIDNTPACLYNICGKYRTSTK